MATLKCPSQIHIDDVLNIDYEQVVSLLLCMCLRVYHQAE